MGGFFSRHDPDDVFAYNTIKLITIRDRYLGILHHLCQLIIFGYIFVIVIFVNLNFLDKQQAYGAVKLSLQDPVSVSPTPDYCSPAPSHTLPQKLPCIFNDREKGIQGQGNLFLTTHLTMTEYRTNCTSTSHVSSSSSPSSSYILVSIIFDYPSLHSSFFLFI
eukprot:TRINITY_DN11010_c0_g1_i1.p1 TRINITY_DN11010_c0_g1~~TRINITY_DN11010_c0_g1_i1.p1  ORF type:complete len:163 (+),score=32.14 TRINITY_DN11010_c0_g1_i1:93-581(+)